MKITLNLETDVVRIYGMKEFDPLYPEPITVVAKVPEHLYKTFDKQSLAAYVFTYLKNHKRLKGLPKFVRNVILRNIKEIQVEIVKGKQQKVVKKFSVKYNPNLFGLL